MAVTDVRYGYTGSGDTAELTLGPDRRLLTRSIALPGGVLYTWKPVHTDETWDHPTVRGDLALTTSPTGRKHVHWGRTARNWQPMV